MRSVFVAYILWFFFGMLGVHRFYTGNWITGIVQLLTGGGFVVWFVLDAFMIPFLVAQHNKHLGDRQEAGP